MYNLDNIYYTYKKKKDDMDDMEYDKTLKHYGFKVLSKEDEDKIKNYLEHGWNENKTNILEILLKVNIISNIDDVLEEYDEIKVIGEGSFGLVYSGIDKYKEKIITKKKKIKKKHKVKKEYWAIKISKEEENKLNFTNGEDLYNILTEMAYYHLFSKNEIGPQLPELNKAFL
jgi:hypothetical protein